MVLTIILGVILGAGGLALVRQWLNGALAEPSAPVLPVEAFPRLAAPSPRAAVQFRRRAA